MPDKACTRCGVTKPLDLYYRNRSKRDGRHEMCKACHRDIYLEKCRIRAGAVESPTDTLRIVKLPRRRYSACPHCGSRALCFEDGEHWCFCGWSEPRYAMVETPEQRITQSRETVGLHEPV